MFTDKDINYIKSKDLTEELVMEQIECFKKGFYPLDINRPAKINDGIKRLSKSSIQAFSEMFEKVSISNTLLKFVPASGAATRMFKQLFEFKDYINKYPNASDQELIDNNHKDALEILSNINQMACSNDLEKALNKDNLSIDTCLEERKYAQLIEHLLEEKALNYSHLPKALIPFHPYSGHSTLALEEQLIEASQYACSEGIARLHFTVSQEHLEKFKDAIASCSQRYEEKYNIKYEVSFSVQKPYTDTIAVDINNKPFRNKEEQLLFRPGGHGALIENLNELDADIIFIKNIDNVVQEKFLSETTIYKKALGSMLILLRDKIFDYMEMLEDGNLNNDELDQIRDFAKEELSIDITPGFDAFFEIEKVDYLYNILNRPIRICGMVKNEGEPGGGPFWVENDEGTLSLQIVEQSQIDMNDEDQKKVALSATHFNPVDIICSTKDYTGENFHLPDFVDPETGFISRKSLEGKELKALELPGLWNGAMSDWITIFVEVPAITFNPVKTFHDLLKKEHCI
ncbi:MAG: DUF4301 family protein [Hyphomicrobiales bacterium]